ncbi:hypothetical protein [Sciscionella marina]|uniref:hypothetical protein n=1 Tax=Sciscionella marina TaxID=508770 RepID=UPI00035C1E3D|nr:hypothetical protein [Sciscionella marina]
MPSNRDRDRSRYLTLAAEFAREARNPNNSAKTRKQAQTSADHYRNQARQRRGR